MGVPCRVVDEHLPRTDPRRDPARFAEILALDVGAEAETLLVLDERFRDDPGKTLADLQRAVGVVP